MGTKSPAPKRHRRTWRDEELEALKSLSAQYTDRQIAYLLDRSPGSVAMMRITLGIKRMEQPERLRGNGKSPTAPAEEFDPFKAEVPESDVHYSQLSGEEREEAFIRQVIEGDEPTPPNCWNPDQEERFKSALRIFMEGDMAVAWQMMLNGGLTRLGHDAGYKIRTAEFCRLAAELASFKELTRNHEQREMRQMAEQVRGLLDVSTFDSPCLVCPTCEFNYVHIHAVEVKTFPHSATVDHSGVRLLAGCSGRGGRGSGVRLQCHCENGHTFEVEFYFHKGQVYVCSEHKKDLVCERDGTWRELPKELWRE